jgi:hypothetical protein
MKTLSAAIFRLELPIHARIASFRLSFMEEICRTSVALLGLQGLISLLLSCTTLRGKMRGVEDPFLSKSLHYFYLILYSHISSFILANQLIYQGFLS